MGRGKQKSQPGPYLMHLELLRERLQTPDQKTYNLPAFRNLNSLSFHPQVTFFVGENGSGKSTLLEAIAIASGLNAEGGSINFNFATRSSHSQLEQAIRLGRSFRQYGDSYFLRAESFYNVATEIENLDRGPGGNPIILSYGGQSLHEQSHGESFFALFQNRFRDNGFYLLDEPEAALSPKRQLQFLALLHDYVCRGCQFVIATHSPIILAYPKSQIYSFDSTGIQPIDYRDTEHYRITAGFLNNPTRNLAILMDETDTKEVQP